MFPEQRTFTCKHSYYKLGNIQMEVDMAVHWLTVTGLDSYRSCCRELLTRFLRSVVKLTVN